MSGRIELVSDGDGVVVAGDHDAVERFLARAGLMSEAAEGSLIKLSAVARAGGEVAKTASEIVEQSALYLKLTTATAGLESS